MSNYGCYIIKKQGQVEIVSDRYLAIDGLFLIDITLGLKYLESSIDIIKDCLDENRIDNLNLLCENGHCYLEGAILLDYDEKKIHFSDDGLFPKNVICFIENAVSISSDLQEWSIHYQPKGIKKNRRNNRRKSQLFI